MFNRKSIYLFLLSATICSIIGGFYLFLIVLGISLITVLIMNRGVFYTIRANKFIAEGYIEKGYPLLERAYKTNTVPYMVINGYIYISLKFGHFDRASEAIDRVLKGKVSCKIKETHRSQALTLKALYLYKVKELKDALEILDDLYEKGYRNTIFYGLYGYLLYFDNNLEKAEKLCLEAYDYGNSDKVTIDNLVSIYITLNRWDEAKKYLDILLDLKPNFPEAYFHGAQIALNSKSLDLAKEYIDKASNMEITHISSISKEDIITLKDKIEEM